MNIAINSCKTTGFIYQEITDCEMETIDLVNRESVKRCYFSSWSWIEYIVHMTCGSHYLVTSKSGAQEWEIRFYLSFITDGGYIEHPFLNGVLFEVGWLHRYVRTSCPNTSFDSSRPCRWWWMFTTWKWNMVHEDLRATNNLTLKEYVFISFMYNQMTNPESPDNRYFTRRYFPPLCIDTGNDKGTNSDDLLLYLLLKFKHSYLCQFVCFYPSMTSGSVAHYSSG